MDTFQKQIDRSMATHTYGSLYTQLTLLANWETEIKTKQTIIDWVWLKVKFNTGKKSEKDWTWRVQSFWGAGREKITEDYHTMLMIRSWLFGKWRNKLDGGKCTSRSRSNQIYLLQTRQPEGRLKYRNMEMEYGVQYLIYTYFLILPQLQAV